MTVVFACRNFVATKHRGFFIIKYFPLRKIVLTMSFQHFSEMIWIFSRTKSLTKEKLEKAYSVIKANKLSVDPTEPVDQKNCPKEETVDKLSRNRMYKYQT